VCLDDSGNGFNAAVQGDVAQAAEGKQKSVARFAHEGHLVVDEPQMFNLPDVTIALWIRPDKVQGRMGLVGKRLGGGAAPYILSLWDGGLEFEATDVTGKWSFNFRTPAVIKPGVWQHVAVTVKEGEGVTIYVDGKPVGNKKNDQKRVMNNEPLVIGREAWAGQNNVHNPCFYSGLMDDLKIWPRALSPEEVRQEGEWAR
jgi:hypothetical protein